MSAAKSEKAKTEKADVRRPRRPRSPKGTKGKKVVDIKDAPKVASPEKLINLLTAPHITEKTSLAMQNANTYSFRVLRARASRDQGRRRADVRREGGQGERGERDGQDAPFRQAAGRTQDIKKAYVRLAPGQTIDYEAKIKA